MPLRWHHHKVKKPGTAGVFHKRKKDEKRNGVKTHLLNLSPDIQVHKGELIYPNTLTNVIFTPTSLNKNTCEYTITIDAGWLNFCTTLLGASYTKTSIIIFVLLHRML